MRGGFIKTELKRNYASDFAGISISGVLVVDKPKGMTSFGVDSRIKKELRCMKVGHAGTLDPFATGVLPLLINKATKIQDKLINIPKSYEGVIKLGLSTNTLDILGEVVDNRTVGDSEVENIADYLGRLSGDFVQKIPVFSAKKFKGVPLYKYARENIAVDNVDNSTNTVKIYEFKVKSFENPYIFFGCKVSKGTYIRAFAQEIIDKFAVPAHIFELRRTSSGGFDIDKALSLESLEKGRDFIMENIIPLKDIKS